MPVYLASFLVPKNGATWFLLEDKYLRGGYRVVTNLADRDAIHSLSRKAGMLVYVQEEGKTYRLAADDTTWNEDVSSGGSGSGYGHIQNTPSDVWAINHRLNTKFFTIKVFDTSGVSMSENQVRTIDLNHIEVEFNIPVAGYAAITAVR